MNRQITKLMPEQIARFDEWSQKWIDIGLSTEPADFGAATDAAFHAYDLCNLQRPKIVLRMGSPYGATLGGALAVSYLQAYFNHIHPQVRSQVAHQVWDQVENQVRNQVLSQVWNQVRNQVWDQVRNQVRNQVWDQVRNQVWDQVRNQVAHQVVNQVRNQVLSQVWNQVENQVENQVRNQVWDQVAHQVRNQVVNQVENQVLSQVWNQVAHQVENQVRNQVRNQVWDQVENQVENQVLSQVWDLVKRGLYNYSGGSFWANWCAYISFFRDVMGWQDPILNRFTINETLCRSCGWVWWHEDVLAISDRPSIISLDEDGGLHSDDGPAVLYRDGWALFRQHGEEWDEKSLALQAIKASLGMELT